MARILVVEDNPDNMKLIRALLSRRRHVLAERMSGGDLGDVLAEFAPELVLMDIQLPGKDGFALLDEIRRSPVPRTKVVALTAQASRAEEQRAADAGFDGYLTKPINVHTFSDEIARILEG